MIRKTRKLGKNKALTIPQLRRSIEHIDAFVARKGNDVTAFRKEWKKTFGKEVSLKAAKEYLEIVLKRKGQGQSGGMAPLNYELGAGGDASPSVPPYVSGGFGFANNDGFASSCGKEDITPVPHPRLGSNLVGGGKGGKGKKTRKGRKGRKDRKDQRGGALPIMSQLSNNFAEFLSRPVIPMSSPPSMAQDMQMLSKGYNGLASPLPQNPSFNFAQTPPIYNTYVSPSSVRV